MSQEIMNRISEEVCVNVLIVGDNPAAIDRIRNELITLDEKINIRTSLVTDHAEVNSSLLSPDLVIIDQSDPDDCAIDMLPNQQCAVEVVSEQQKTHSNIEIIVLTVLDLSQPGNAPRITAMQRQGVQLFIDKGWLPDVRKGILLGELQRVREEKIRAKQSQELETSLHEVGRQAAYYHTLFNNVRVGLIVARPGTEEILDCNDEFLKLTRRKRQDVVGKELNRIIAKEEDWEQASKYSQLVAEGETVSIEAERIRSDGTMFPAHIVGVPIMVPGQNGKEKEEAIYGMYQDITDRKEKERLAEERATRDPMTGLFNRRFSEEYLQQALLTATRNGEQLAVLYIDCNDFKTINDLHTHSIGDLVLIQVVQRMKKAVRQSDVVARQGGDEFIIILPDVGNADMAKIIAKRVIRLVEKRAISVRDKKNKHKWRGKLRISIGISLFKPGEDIEAQELVQRADEAMSRAKKASKIGGCSFHLDGEAIS